MKKTELRQMIREEIQKLNEDDTSKFLDKFKDEYPYVQHGLSKQEVKKWLNQSYIKKASDKSKMDMFFDYLGSQGLGDMQESTSLEETIKKLVKEEIEKLEG